jgi:hypothetical protein
MGITVSSSSGCELSERGPGLPIPPSPKIAPGTPLTRFALAPKADRRFRWPERLKWMGDGLYLDGKGRAIVTIEPDAKYPDVMWRVRLPSGELSDMVNRTRCKDAALAYACRMLGGT